MAQNAVGQSKCKVFNSNFIIPNLPQFPDIGQNSDKGTSDFQISGQSFINKKCHN